MTIKSAKWVHGTIVEAEYPDRLTSFVRKGWGTDIVGKENTTNWFHIPITTPVIMDDVRPLLVRVWILYNAGSEGTIVNPIITNLHLYDGGNKVCSFDGLDLSGDHSRSLDEFNKWDIKPPITIHSGLGISVGVKFLCQPPPVGCSTRFRFTAVGADFKKP